MTFRHAHKQGGSASISFSFVSVSALSLDPAYSLTNYKAYAAAVQYFVPPAIETTWRIEDSAAQGSVSH